MRKLTFVLVAAALAASTVGCCGRCRNFFHKANPCGTAIAPAMLSAPVAMSAPPMMAAPQVYAAPNMCVEAQPACVPCVPCCPDPCAQGFTTGYLGGEGCCDGSTMGGVIQTTPGMVTPATPIPAYPGPVTEG